MLYNLKKYIDSRTNLSIVEIFEIANLFKPLNVENGQYFHFKNKKNCGLYFIDKGILKCSITNKGGNEVQKYYAEGSFVTDLGSFNFNSKTKFKMVPQDNLNIYRAVLDDVFLLMRTSIKHKVFFEALFKDKYLFNLEDS